MASVVCGRTSKLKKNTYSKELWVYKRSTFLHVDQLPRWHATNWCRSYCRDHYYLTQPHSGRRKQRRSTVSELHLFPTDVWNQHDRGARHSTIRRFDDSTIRRFDNKAVDDSTIRRFDKRHTTIWRYDKKAFDDSTIRQQGMWPKPTYGKVMRLHGYLPARCP